MSLKSLNLLIEDKYKNLILNPEAIEKLTHLFGDLIICTCLGDNQSGKSFLLNQLHNKINSYSHKQCAFDINHDKGLNKNASMNFTLSKIELNKEEANLMIFDTEGFEANDKRLFLFSVLISSLLIYNTNDILFDGNYTKLDLMSNLSSTIKLKSSLAWNLAANNELKDEGPFFISLVRDSDLKIINKNEQKIDFFLKMDNVYRDPYGEVSYRNRIRTNMISYFKRIESLHLPKPSADQSVLNSIEKLVFFDDLNKDFLDGFNHLCNEIKCLKSKKINNFNFNGVTLSAFMSQIVELINKDKIIYIYDLMSNICANETKYYENKYSHVIDELKIISVDNLIRRRNVFESGLLKLKTLIPKYQIDSFYLRLILYVYSLEMTCFSKEFPVKLNFLLSKSEQEFYYCWSKFTLCTPNNKLDENFKLFTSETKRILNDMIRVNDVKINDFNMHEAVKLWNRVYRPKYDSNRVEYSSFNEFLLDLIKFKAKFRTHQFDYRNNVSDLFWNDFERIINVNNIEIKIKQTSFCHN